MDAFLDRDSAEDIRIGKLQHAQLLWLDLFRMIMESFCLR